jgi:hypothetical protein
MLSDYVSFDLFPSLSIFVELYKRVEFYFSEEELVLHELVGLFSFIVPSADRTNLMPKDKSLFSSDQSMV